MSTSQGRNAEELKNLVLQTLETNGVLGQIRAQLRANVYKAIDCDEEQVAAEPSKAKLTKSPVGKLMAEIVAEFFEFYQLRHSLSVFLLESNLGKDRRNSAEVAFDAGLVRVGTETSILEQLTGLAAGSGPNKGVEGWHSSASSTTASSPPPQIAASLASTRHSASAAESAVPSSGSETPPAGLPLPGGLGTSDRSRAGGEGSGGAAAIVDTIRSVAGSSEGSKLHAEDKASPEAAITSEEEQQDEGSRRKPFGGKLPSLGGGSGGTSPIGSSGGGKDLLPALRSSGLQHTVTGSAAVAVGSSGGCGGNSPGSVKSGSAEEVVLGDAGGDDQQVEEADRHFDQQIARLNRAAGTGLENSYSVKEEALRGQRGSCKVPSAHSAAAAGGVLGMGGLGSSMSRAPEAVSSPAGARSSSRSPESSPERSASPGAGSPAASSASRSAASRSASSPSEVQEANDRSGMTASASEPGTPSQAGGSAGAKAAVEPFDAEEESISIGSDGSGDLDLTGRAGLNSSGEGGSSSLAAGRLKAVPASQEDDDNAVDEVEESISEGDFSVEGYQESEAKDSDNDKF
eukprot:TRINITY_DN25630_c0_g1_i1.p1 TRINITY_DN25630_c0_g1~~TRINITY_DN25630_c0_g1_i1.p1  ORF type:complete len:573 (+),score=152.85 TRINITY_DN25630_c0_g1_i1:68-1786(+)